MVQKVLHSTKRDEGRTALRGVAYDNHGHVPSQYPAYTNVITGVPQVEPGECIMRDARHALRNERRQVALLKELVQRYLTTGPLVVDIFAGIILHGDNMNNVNGKGQIYGM